MSLIRKTKNADSILANGACQTAEHGKTDYILIGINRICDNDCLFCTDNESHPELNTDANGVIKRIDSLNIKKYRTIILSGGEPAEQEGISGIISHLTREGHTVQIITNARKFSDNIFSKNVADSGLKTAITEIHSSIPEVHDYITQRPGSFNETVLGIRNLINLNVNVQIKIILNRINYKTLPQIIKYICRTFPESKINITTTNISGNALKNKELLAVRFSEAAEYIEKGINVANRFNARVSISCLPLCVLRPQYRTYILSNVQYQYLDVGSDKMHTPKRHFAPSCERCIDSCRCMGFWRSYLDLFGESEIPPIFAKD
ncbi:MAG: radical SAM protein [Nanoarchaeota archaeon]|nr:radical SAM protein [Nanoarchaeota archaeon]MBU4300499.1 radical SAM protein [Nanoarchaeota archaeon]MBU4451979.1 radical SAM protein [Nanoarchaeota archaeon]MCG2724139.1 radical SAM protein [archaeon]